jgi:DNA-binding transcriptional LysR family regulator
MPTSLPSNQRLSPRLMNFMQQHPSATLKLQSMIDLGDFLNEGIDIAIRWGNGHWPDVASEELFNCPLMACAGPLATQKVTLMDYHKPYRAPHFRCFPAVARPPLSRFSFCLFQKRFRNNYNGYVGGFAANKKVLP